MKPPLGLESLQLKASAGKHRKPTRRERANTTRLVRSYTKSITAGGLEIQWSNLTENEARRLIDLTTNHDRSTSKWWPLVLRATQIQR